MPARRMHPPERVAEYRASGAWTDETVQDLFAARVRERGDALAVVDPPNKAELVGTPPRRLTWAELAAEVEALAAALHAEGIGVGDVVAVQLPNVVELVMAYLAVWRLRAIIAPLPMQYRTHELQDIAEIAAPKLLLSSDRLRALPGGDVAGVEAYADAHPVDPNDCVTICWTSGTEAKPKGVPRAHYEWLAISIDTVRAPGLTTGSRLLNPFPMVNMAAISGMLLPWLRTGCVLVQHHPFDLATFLAQVQDERITYTLAPPAVLALLLQRPELLAATDISSLTALGSGSAPLQDWMVRGWQEQHGLAIINYFGSNEGTALVTDVEVMADAAVRARFFPRYGSGVDWTVTAARWTQLKLVDPLTGAAITETGTPGELRLRGPTVFAGYLPGTGVVDPFDADGYLRTGDLFAIDGPRGEYLRYVDRAKDLIIRGGMNIAPAELETLIAAHPAVAEVAVVGYPDDVLGERVCAVVVTRPDTSVSLADVTAHLDALGVARYKLPERLELRSALPRNPVGKILKRELRGSLGYGATGT